MHCEEPEAAAEYVPLGHREEALWPNAETNSPLGATTQIEAPTDGLYEPTSHKVQTVLPAGLGE